MIKLLLCLFIVLISGNSFAQDPDPVLLETDWYLHNIIIDGDNNIPYGTNYDFEIDFYEDEGQHYFYFGAGALNTVWINYIAGEQKFEITQLIGLAKNVCWNGNDACLIYEGIYQAFYETQIGAELDYLIEPDGGGVLRLTVTTAEGDEAIYRSIVLSNSDILQNEFVLYPNPATDVLFISSEKAFDFTIAIYDVTGQLLLELSPTDSQIDVSMLGTGIYFAEITSEEGKTVQKFIKK